MTFLKISLVVLLRSWQTWAHFKAGKVLYRTRESTGTRESKGRESTSPKCWTRSSTSFHQKLGKVCDALKTVTSAYSMMGSWKLGKTRKS